MNSSIRNVSFDGGPVELQLTAPYLVLIDPLALDGLRDELQATAEGAPEQQRRALHAVQSPVRIGVHEIPNFRPGLFRVGLGDFEKADKFTSSPGGSRSALAPTNSLLAR